MRYKLFFILPSLLMLDATCKKNEDGRNNLILEATFEGNNALSGWDNDQHCCDYSLTQSHDKFTEGSSSLRIEVRSTDPQTSKSIRSELVQKSDEVGTERWYGFNMFLENWSDDNAGESVFQWHPGNTTGTGTASLWTSGGRYVYERNTGGPDNEYTDLGPVVSNQWVPWVIHVKWAADNTGIMQVWKNGKLVMDKTGIPTSPPEGTYFKLGMNKWGWLDQPSTVTKRVFYYDEVRIGNEKASYEDVKPGP
ncbi:MAG: polysaccharide lyase [Bacteroidota bacterium]